MAPPHVELLALVALAFLVGGCVARGVVAWSSLKKAAGSALREGSEVTVRYLPDDPGKTGAIIVLR